MHSEIGRFDRPTVWLGFCCLVAAFAYLPILNNGFIADDYVILQRIEILKAQPLYLFQVPPENFRFVSYVIFGVLKALAGYQARLFYAFNIALHVVNIILLYRLLRTVLNDETTARLATLLFAVFQAPQEAIMWLAAMNETTLLFFTLITLLTWLQKRYGFALLAYALALFSKESAIVIPVLIVLIDWYKERRLVWQRYAVLLIPTMLFMGIFIFTLSNNFMLSNRSYTFGPQAIPVLAKSLHRLLWPWFYIIIVITWIQTRRLPSLLRIGTYLGGVLVTMTPYMFIAYQTALPSRQLYIASAVLMTMFAALMRPLRGTLLLKITIVAFVAFNIGYLWLRKDEQFEQRAAPTTELINMLRQHSPEKTVIRGFAYPYPAIASAATLAVPGWDVGMVSADDDATDCTDCWQLRWNSDNYRYEAAKER